MILKVLNRNEEYIGNVEVYDFEHRWVLNGEHAITCKTDSPLIEELYRLVFQDEVGRWFEFIVTEPVTEHADGDYIEYEIYAEDSFYETLWDFVEDKRPQNATATAALMAALEASRWEVGNVENLGINSTNYYRESVKEAIQKKLIPTWGAEFDTRIEVVGNKITHRYVDLYAKMGQWHGKRFVYQKDMTAIKRTVDVTGLATALYGYGKGEELESGGYGRRIDFSDINNGKAYVENIDARNRYGRNHGTGKAHLFAAVEFDDITDPAELLRLTKQELEYRSQPRVTYECSVVDMGIDFEKVNRGDTVLVKDNDLDITITARVVEMVKREDSPTEITLGDYRPLITDTINDTVGMMNDFRAKSGVWDRAEIIKEGGIDASFLRNLVAELNAQMNDRGGYVYVSDDGQGITTYDRPLDQNPTMAIQILGGSFRISNKRNADGTWAWTTFGDGNGFVADYIVSGMLKGGNVRFNLSDGTLLIGRNTTDYQLYFDGTNLHIPGKLLIEEINGQNLKLAGKNITLDGDTTVLGTFSVPGSSLFGTINAQTIRIKNQDLSEFVRGFLNTPTFDTGFGSSQTHLKGPSVAMSTNSSYITLRDTGGRGEFLVQGTAGAKGSSYFYEFNAGGVYGGTSQGAAVKMVSHTGGRTWLCDNNGNPIITLYNGSMYYQGKKIVLNTDNSGIHYE